MQSFLRHLPFLLITLVMTGPLVWMVGASLKSSAEISTSPHTLLPAEPRLANYANAVRGMPFWRYLMNTMLLCIGSVIGTLASCTLVAYAFARLQWPGRDLLFGIVIATMLLPWQATMIPRFLLLRELGLYNTLWAIVLPTLGGNAFFIFLLRQFFRTIPQELIDAARMDGCGNWGVFWRVIVPLSRPALVTVALLEFIAVWNDYGGPLLYLSDPEKFPLAYGLEQFVGSHSSETHLLMAAAVLFTLPILVLFFAAQKTFMRGISTTGIKG